MVEKTTSPDQDGWGEMTSEAIQAMLVSQATPCFSSLSSRMLMQANIDGERGAIISLSTSILPTPLFGYLFVGHLAHPSSRLDYHIHTDEEPSKRELDVEAMPQSRDLSIDLDPRKLKYSHPVNIPPAASDILCGHPKEALDLLQASRGRWVPQYIHRYKREKEGIWGKWNNSDDDIVYELEEVKAFWYTGEKSTAEEAPPSRRQGDPVMLHFHGGGYVLGTAAETSLSSNFPKALVKHSPIHHVLSVDYRLAPTAPWPLPLLDAISAYHWLVKVEGVEEGDITVAGDSAGGHLALSLVRWLRDQGQNVGLKMPRGMVLLSPWADLGFTNVWGEEAIRHNKDSDTIDDTFGPFACSLLLRALPASIMHTSPYISPASLLLPESSHGENSFEKFPATYIVYGGAERLSTNIQLLWSRIQLSRKIESPIVPDRLFVSPDAIHDFMIFPWMAEEASEMYEDLDGWLRELLSADLPEEDEQSVVESLELEESPAASWKEISWKEMVRQRRLSRQMTRESIKSHKSPVMGPVQDDLGMIRMMEDMSEEGLRWV
ncbi:hypothetical protein L486_01086 [Kwoniella mangroviensis CBS 10435]|uniref:Alpha/beta hydrolase fold-3 domain-containing protein n=1 Tax=Kwoniella mangroviensis CBS 10435 TaxID=1331196 RepID=A0A1B9J0Y2_9TREE|nr:hypothetical protein L486_01086 [Kwoniella mangroviensis CBS 10435]